MENDPAVVLAVERAAAHAWNCILKPGFNCCPALVPPTDPYVLGGFVNRAAEWLRVNAEDVFSEVLCVQGTHTGRDAHMWIEARLAACETTVGVVIDISTPDKSDMHLMASDSTFAIAAEKKYNIYFRRISILRTEAASAYVRTQVMPAHEEPVKPTVQTDIGAVLLAFLERSGAAHFIPLDAHVDQLANCFMQPADASNPECIMGAKKYAHVVYGLMREMWTHMFEPRAPDDVTTDLFERIDIAWKAVFGPPLLWRQRRAALMTCSLLSMNERAQIDAVSIAYHRVCEAYEQVLTQTDQHVAAKISKNRFPLICVPPVRSPVHELLLRVLEIGADTEQVYKIPSKIALRVGARYPPNVLYLMERVTDLVASGRAHDDATFKMVRGEIDVLEMTFSKGASSEIVQMCHEFFVAALRFAHTTKPDISRFQAMLTAWLELDAHYLLPEPEPAVPPKPPPPPEPVHVPYVAVTLRYTIVESAAELHVDVAPLSRAESNGTWTAEGELIDLLGNAWTLETAFGAGASQSEGVHMLMCTLAIWYDPKFRAVDVVRLVGELPAAARLPEQVLPWAHSIVPYLMGPLVARLAGSPVKSHNPWNVYVEETRRAVQLLKASRHRSLQAVIVPCPRIYGVSDLDPEMHEIDQWLVYFAAMPPSIVCFLDMQRKRYGASFFVQRGLAGGEERLFTRITMRPAPRELVVKPSPPGAIKSLDVRLSDAIWEWLSAKSDEKSATVRVPENVLRPAAAAAVDQQKCIVGPEHISEDMLKVYGMVSGFMHVGMLFARRKGTELELEVFRDVSYFFELSFTKKMVALAAAVRTGDIADEPTTALYIDLSRGYLADGIKDASDHLPKTLVVCPTQWRNDTLAFLAGWVRVHLCRAVERSLVVLRVSPARIEFLPSVQLVCRERDVFFMVTVYLTNKLEGTRSETFPVSGGLTVDCASGMCTINLGDNVAKWFANRVLSYGDVEGTHVRVAPFTRASGKVYMHATGSDPVVMGTFNADFSVSNHHVRTTGITIDYASDGVASDACIIQNAHIARHKRTVIEIMCGATTRPSDDDALRAVRALAVYKYYESFRKMPIYTELEDRVAPHEFRRAVLTEYYTNPLVHPDVRSVACTFDVKKFVRALYRRENAFLSTIQ